MLSWAASCETLRDLRREAGGAGIIEKSHTSSLWNISSKLLSVQSTGRSSVSYVRISFLFICENSKNDQFNHK